MRVLILFLLIIFILATLPCYAFGPIMGGGVTAAPAGDSCTDGLILSAHFENSDNIEDGTPAGCNANATKTWTKSANVSYSSTQAQDGTYSIYCNACVGTDSITIPTTGFSATSGTIDVYFYFSSMTIYDSLPIFYVDGNNYVRLYVSSVTGGVTINGHYKGGGVGQEVSTAALAVNTWHHIVFKYRTASSPYLSIQANSDDPVTGTTALTEMTGTPTFYAYFPYTGPSTYYTDSLKVYNTWQ